jgi:lipoprotein-releasing system ATP-binding protein
VSFALAPSETLAIVGYSGTGKSTLLNIVGSLDHPTAGSVRLGDTDVTQLAGAALAEFRSRRVGFVFQDHHLLPQCTALENVALPTLAAGRAAIGTELATDLLQRVGLADRLHSRPAQLSGGERQRVAIARALVNDPPLLLADEPTGNLDPDTSRRIGALFAELAAERSAMLIVVTHNLELAGQFGRCLELRDGVLRSRG